MPHGGERNIQQPPGRRPGLQGGWGSVGQGGDLAERKDRHPELVEGVGRPCKGGGMGGGGTISNIQQGMSNFQGERPSE